MPDGPQNFLKLLLSPRIVFILEVLQRGNKKNIHSPETV